MKKYSHNPPNGWLRRHLILATVAVLALVSLIAGLELSNKTFIFHKRPTKTTRQQSGSTPSVGTVNYGPPTSADKQATEQHKQDLANSTPATSTPGSVKTVKPVITYASQNGDKIEIDSFVPGIVEDHGSCSVNVTKDSYTITKQVTAVRNANVTNCPAFYVNRSDIPSSGTWSVRVSYLSASASGSSDPSNLEVK